MSKITLHDVKCPKCGKEQQVERWDSINNYNSEMFENIIDRSIFDWKCDSCEEMIHEPYPILFHLMGVRDVMIGYKMPVPNISFTPNSPLLIAMKHTLESLGANSSDIRENYDDEDAFVERVMEFVDPH